MKVFVVLMSAVLGYAQGASLGAPMAMMRMPQFDSAVISMERLGGNFAYETKEAHAYAVAQPIIQNVPTPIGASYVERPVFGQVTYHEPASAAVIPAAPAYYPAPAAPIVADYPMATAPVMGAPTMPAAPIMGSPAMPAAPIMDAPSMPAAPIMGSPAMPGSPIMGSPAMPGAPIMDAPSMPGSPIMGSPAMPGAPIMDAPAMPAAPVMGAPAMPQAPISAAGDDDTVTIESAL